MKTKNIRGGYILISLGMIALTTSLTTLEIDYKRLTETKKSIRLCNINIGGIHKPDINIKPEFGSNTITLPDVYGLDLIVSSDNSVEITEHRSAYELPIPEVADAGKTIIVDSEGKYGLDDMPNELPIPEVADEGKIVTVDSEGKYALGSAPSSGTKLYKHSFSCNVSSGSPLDVILISTDNTPVVTLSSGGPDRLGVDISKIVSITYKCSNGAIFVLGWTQVYSDGIGFRYGELKTVGEQGNVLIINNSTTSLYGTDTVTEL